MVDFDVFIFVLRKGVVACEMRLADFAATRSVRSVLLYAGGHILQEFGKILLLYECDHDAEILPPRQIPQELINGLQIESLS